MDNSKRKKDLIIIGCPRSGKTTLTKMLTDDNNDYIVISLDSLTNAIRATMPEIKMDETGKIFDISKRIVPFLVKYLQEYRRDYPNKSYIIEGIQANPIHIKQEKFFDDAQIVCLGYPNSTMEQILHNIRENDKVLEHSYTREYNDEQLWKKIAFYIRYSKLLQKKCYELKIQFYETDKNRQQVLEQVYNQIINEQDLDNLIER